MFKITEKIRALLNNLPTNSGVYLMKNSDNKIIYVGKAVNLKNRVRQYFQSQRNMSPKVRAMVSHIEEFEYIITDSEMEALILENNLIKEYKPPYNILLRDDKTYPYIKITLGEYFPRVVKTRRVIGDGSKYFGPYSNAFIVNDIVEMIHKVFKVRSCKRDIKRSIEKKERACLNYQINTCDGPCLGIVKEEDYAKTIDEVIKFLESKDDRLIVLLKEDMYKASENKEYEKAAKLRDKIIGIEQMLEKQKIVKVSDDNQDFIAVENIEEIYCIQLFFVRNGKVVGRENYIFDKEIYPTRKEVIGAFVKQFYIKSNFIPKEICINEEIEDMDLVEKILSDKKGTKVTITIPKRGYKKDLLKLVSKNAIETIKQKKAKMMEKIKKSATLQAQLQKALDTDREILRIESYDISNIQGVDSVGGQVVFIDGKKQPKLYRRYKIKTVDGADDYASMVEIIDRRLKHPELPQLILVDGGKGHVRAVRELIIKRNLDILVYGMYKDDSHKTMGLSSDTENFPLDKHSQLYRFISHIQEEVHRFAISYHRTIRDKYLNKSQLDEIEGIGKKRKMNLLKSFKSVENIKKATVEELSAVESMNKKAAEKVYEYFRKRS